MPIGSLRNLFCRELVPFGPVVSPPLPRPSRPYLPEYAALRAAELTRPICLHSAVLCLFFQKPATTDHSMFCLSRKPSTALRQEERSQLLKVDYPNWLSQRPRPFASLAKAQQPAAPHL